MRRGLILLLILLATACQPPVAPAATLRGVALAGPTCPVVTDPPDPACEDRPVADAEIVVLDEAGEAVARVRTADDGTFAISLAPGRYELVPQPVDGLMGTAATVPVVVEAGPMGEPIAISYDTGIR